MPTDNTLEDVSPAATQICYCPHLGIYYYSRADGSEYFFNTAELIKSIDTYHADGNDRQGEFMACLTSFARKFPHKVVSFDEKGELNLKDLLPEVSEDDANIGPALIGTERQIEDKASDTRPPKKV